MVGTMTFENFAHKSQDKFWISKLKIKVLFLPTNMHICKKIKSAINLKDEADTIYTN